MNSSASRWHHGLLLGLILGMALLALSYVRIYGDATQSMLFSSRMLLVMFDGPIWGTTLGDNLVRFVLGALLMHLLYGATCWLLGHLSARAWPSSKASVRQHILLWFILLTAGLLAHNSAKFVASSLGQPYAKLMTPEVLGMALGQWIWAAVLTATIITVVLAGLRWWQDGGRLNGRSYLGLGTLGAAYIAVSSHSILPTPAPGTFDKPNVILIGLDSLRVDLLDPLTSPGVTPHINAYMRASATFSDAMTPLARTFPAMCAMFTGRRPHRSGAFMNLLPRELVDDSESLPRVLQRQGYHTIYATDEVRFANIDESYGFAQTITPPIGASDFVIAKVADSPLTNLLMNTRLASWLFPHTYANRGAATTYDPDSFVKRIDRELVVRQTVFLNVHLTLAHWPYTWAGAPIRTRDSEARWPQYYLNAAERVDRQFADIIELLDERGLLENALVIIYSDHGESFESPNEALVPDGDALIESLQIKPRWGHGTTVLTTHQYHIILGMRRYGGNWPSGREFAVPVSLEDVAPTVLDTLAITAPTARFDGRSLLPVLEAREGAKESFQGRIRFTETEYNPEGLASQDGKVSESAVTELASVYRIDRGTDRLTVKPEFLGELMSGRQYAAVGARQLIGAFPSKTGPGYNFLAVNRAGGEARQLFTEPQGDEPELRALWNALHTEFDSLFQGVANGTVADRERTIPRSVTK